MKLVKQIEILTSGGKWAEAKSYPSERNPSAWRIRLTNDSTIGLAGDLISFKQFMNKYNLWQDLDIPHWLF